jgi:N-acetylmuramoyl-L-alanine amidase
MIPEYVMLHHSLTKDGDTVSWPAIRRYHKDVKGWRDIGYHFGIERVTSGGLPSWEILVGRHWTQRGAHCPQGAMNRKAVAICIVGNFDLIPVPDGQWQAATQFVAFLLRRFELTPSRIVGHREYNSAKTCPGTQFNLDKFRIDVATLGVSTT